MRVALCVGLCVLAIALAGVRSDSLFPGGDAGESRPGPLSLLATGRGPMMSAPRFTNSEDNLGSVLFVGDRSLSVRRDAPGLRVAVVSPDFELMSHERYDVATVPEDAGRLRALVDAIPVDGTVVLGSTGRIAPADLEQRARLQALADELGSAVEPFAGPPCSWALIALRRPDGWVLLSEALSRTDGVLTTFALDADLDRYDGFRGESLLVGQGEAPVLRLGEQLVAAHRKSSQILFRRGFEVGGVTGAALSMILPRQPRPDGSTQAYIRWLAVPIPAGATFVTALGLPERRGAGSSGARFSLWIDGEPVHEASVGGDGAPTGAWVPFEVDLRAWAEREVELELRVDPLGEPEGLRALWRDPRIRGQRVR